MRADHIIVGSDLSKGSEGEQACLICLEEFSGAYQAFPQTSRSIPNNVACLRKFGGAKAHKKALCSVKSDSALELTEAVKELGWLPEPGLPNDPFHNAKLESGIRRIKEGTRAIHLAAGFPHELWPRSVEYFCIAKSFTTFATIRPNDSDEIKGLKQGQTCYEIANDGESFEGLRVPLGALVYYKPPHHTSKPAFEARTLPGIFVGWRIDAAFKHRKVHLVLDYESLRVKSKGYGRPVQVHASEIVVPENHMFPLFQAEQAKLEGSSGDLPKIALPFDEEPAPPTPARVRKTYVTLDRAIRFGKTVGCRGCDRIAEGVRHSDVCHERFRVLLEKERVESEKKALDSKRCVEPSGSSPRGSSQAPEGHHAPVHDGPERNLEEKSKGEKEFEELINLFEAEESPQVQVLEASEVPAGQAQPLKPEPSNDFWEFDQSKGAWCRVHVKPRKKLFAPVGNDCPFDAKDVLSKRETQWCCKNRTSFYADDWQSNPYQRISQRSWTGRTWFYPVHDVDSKRATIQAAVANARREQSLLRGDEAAEHFIRECSPETKKSLHAMLSTIDTANHSKARKELRTKTKTMFEFCCSSKSSMGAVNADRGIDHFRLSLDMTDLTDPKDVESLKQLVKQFPGCTLWGSLPCDPWSRWQSVNIAKYGKPFAKKLKKKRDMSRVLLKHFIEVSEIVLEQGGHIAFEWPKSAEGWVLPELVAFLKRHNLYVAECHGCFFGLKSSKGKPMFKPWHVATSSFHLASSLNKCRCQHEHGFKHDHAKGKETPKTAFYPEAMSRYISECLNPSSTYAMPVVDHTHCHASQSKVLKGQSQEHVSHQPNLPDLESVYAGVHLLLDRKDWHKHPGYQEAIDKEVNGILENGTWDYSEVIPRSELMKRKEPMHVGRLMTILSVKHWETPSLRKLKSKGGVPW